MSTPVVMPQMGESIAEGTIVRWIKKVGDTVHRDEPLFEISTDKVDAEIPAPTAGVLTEIKVKEGETVPVNSVVGTIGAAGESRAAETAAKAEAPAAAETPAAAEAATAEPSAAAAPAAASTTQPRRGAARAAASTQSQPDGQPGAAKATAPAPPPQGRPDATGAKLPPPDELRRQKSSPLVRRIAKEHDVDISQIPGSGIGGRVTKHDILGYLEETRDSESTMTGRPARDVPAPVARPGASGDQGRIEVKPLSIMRRKIAEHMILSQRTSAHVHSVFHVNFSTVDRIRQQKKGEYERLGTRLTYMTFIAKAVIDALRRHPIVNASVDGDNVIYKKDINLGIAVALESGLIVPVVKEAGEKNMLGLSRAIADVAERARRKQLKPDEVHGGTFTITNPGQFGSQFGLPIINQPQVAILGVGTIEKRPVVIDDAIAIRTMAYLTLGYDHRLIDGAVGDQFMSDIKHQLENFDIEQV